MVKVDIYRVIWHNSWFLNPDRYISLNILETINLTRISNKVKFMIISQAKLLVPSTFWLKLIFTELFVTTPGIWLQTFTLIPISSKLLILQEYVKKQSSGYFTSEAFGLYHFLDKVDIYGVIWYNYWFLNPDRYISLNIFETINPSRISDRGKFMIISQAKLLVPSTFFLKLIFTELFDTTRVIWILTGTLLSISSKLSSRQE